MASFTHPVASKHYVEVRRPTHPYYGRLVGGALGFLIAGPMGAFYAFLFLPGFAALASGLVCGSLVGGFFFLLGRS